MGYLICDKCEGHYKLKPGEAPKDFLSRCNCGGYLNYSLSLVLEKKDHTYQKKLTIMDPRIARITLGVLIVLVPNLYYNNLFLAFSGIPLVLGGFVSSLFTEGDLKEGVLNGARVGLFSLLVYFLITLFLYLFNINKVFISLDMVIIVLSVLLLIILTSAGGLLGNITRRLLIKKETEKTVKKTETTIIYQQDPEEPKYKDEMVKLSYKQMSAINDGEKVFKSLLSRSLSEEDAISHLKEDKNIVDEVLTEMREIIPPDKYREYHELKIAAAKDISKTFDMMDGLVNPDQDKIHQTNELVERSMAKVNQAISELHKTMQDEYAINNNK